MARSTSRDKARIFAALKLTALILAAPILTGCTAPSVPFGQTEAGHPDLSAELVRQDGDTPPTGGPTICWAQEVTPAVIETVTDQVLVSADLRDASGNVVKPAVFSTLINQRMVQDRERVWFRTPCPAQIDATFLASLQRALKARGLYRQGLSGQMDAPTRAAIRKYQAARGLDSDTLSLRAAQALGLIEIPRSEL